MDRCAAFAKLTPSSVLLYCASCGGKTYHRLPNGDPICETYCLGLYLEMGWLDDELRLTEAHDLHTKKLLREFRQPLRRIRLGGNRSKKRMDPEQNSGADPRTSGGTP